jgi:small subunit ribosomal protein S10
MHIKLKSTNVRILSIYIIFLLKVLGKLNVSYKIINSPKKIKRLTLLKSPHVYKKAREQFEFAIYKKCILLSSPISNNVLDFLLINKPKGLKILLKFI